MAHGRARFAILAEEWSLSDWLIAQSSLQSPSAPRECRPEAALNAYFEGRDTVCRRALDYDGMGEDTFLSRCLDAVGVRAVQECAGGVGRPGSRVVDSARLCDQDTHIHRNFLADCLENDGLC